MWSTFLAWIIILQLKEKKPVNLLRSFVAFLFWKKIGHTSSASALYLCEGFISCYLIKKVTAYCLVYRNRHVDRFRTCVYIVCTGNWLNYLAWLTIVFSRKTDLTGSQDGSVSLWEWGQQQPISQPRPPGTYAKVTKILFNAQGNKFGLTDGDGNLSLWQVSLSSAGSKPFFVSFLFNFLTPAWSSWLILCFYCRPSKLTQRLRVTLLSSHRPVF